MYNRIQSIFDYKYRNVPEYYNTMYLDGFTPAEIRYALRKQIEREQEEQNLLKQVEMAKEHEINREIEKVLKKEIDKLLKDFQK